MSGPPIIGLVGPARVGKDSIGARLVDLARAAHRTAQTLALADPLWDAVHAIHPAARWVDATKGSPVLPVPALAPDGADRPRDPRIPRGWAIVIGEAARAAYGPTIWAELALERAQASRAQLVIVTDIRRVSEVEIFRRAGAALYEIERPDLRGVADEVFEAAVRPLVDQVIIVPEGGAGPATVIGPAAALIWDDAVGVLGLGPPPPRTCNRHADCNAADDRARARGRRAADHCVDDACEECCGQ